jgi:RNA ligase (TIGR02306 family)
MARKLVSFQRILDIAPIEGADRIVKIKVLGWWLVTQKSNNFQVGDMVAYFEIDSFLPVRPEWEFLRPSSYRKLADGSEGFRIKTAKFKGQVSQGFALPIQDLENFGYGKFQSVCGDPRWDTLLITNEDPLTAIPVVEGEEITELLGVTKYEPPVPACLAGTAIGYIPSWLETDETRVQVLQPLLDKYQGVDCYVTEKLDGSSFTAFIDDEGKMHVCSRNLDLENTESNSMWKWAIANDLETKLKSLPFRACVQGEIIGEGIQGNRYLLRGQDVRFFNVVNMDTRQHLGIREFMETIASLGFQVVPIVQHDFTLHNRIDDLVKVSYGKSVLNPKADREGIVIRPLQTMYDHEYDVKGGRVSLKVINPDFLLKGGD